MTQSMSNYAYLSIGSNLGDRVANCLRAVREISCLTGVETLLSSSLYETEPVGYINQPFFINMALKIKTCLRPPELLISLKAMEKSLGRKKSGRWGPRLIDIDILLYNEEVFSAPGLNIPHPRMQKRAFVLTPLAEICPGVKHPITGQSISQMLLDASGNAGVRKIGSGPQGRSVK